MRAFSRFGGKTSPARALGEDVDEDPPRRAAARTLSANITARASCCPGAREPSTSIDVQLAMVAGCSTARLHDDLEIVRRGELPPETRHVLEHGGGPRIAEALRQYWTVAIKPFWPPIRAVLDADVAYRASRLARGDIDVLLSDLHPELELAEHAIQVHSGAAGSEHALRGAGLLLVPCVFAWPHVMADIDAGNPPSITYGPRGIGELWPQTPVPEPGGDPLAALLGRTRAAILRSVALPKSTSDLAVGLDQSIRRSARTWPCCAVPAWCPPGRPDDGCSTNSPPLARSVLAANGSGEDADGAQPA